MPNQEEIDQEFKIMALRMALHCVRNTVIEDYHADGKLSQSDMKAFNIEVTNKIYSFLKLFFSPEYESLRNHPEFYKVFYAPSEWNQPQFDQSWERLVKELKSNRG